MDKKDVYESAHKGDYELVRSRLEEDPSLLLKRDSNKRLLIHWAVLSGNVKLVSHLIELKSPLNEPDDTDTTPLILACSAGHTEVVKLLFANLTNAEEQINHTNSYGHSSLQYAASKGWVEICKILLEKNADINIIDSRGSTPMHRAASKDQLEVVKLFVTDNKLKINHRDNYGNTPLHLACEEDRQDVALLLIEHGADIESKNINKQTPIELCNLKLSRLIQSKINKL